MSPEESYNKVDGLIEELRQKSKFPEREKLDDGREVIRSPEAGEFYIRRIQDPEDPAVEKIYDLLVKEFSEDEADTIETIKAAVKSDIQDYRVVEDAEGRIVAVSNMEYLKLEDSKDLMIFVAYVATDTDYRRLGLGSELYPGSYDLAKEKAKEDGSRIKGVIGEAVNTVEPFLNRMGRRRIYFEDKDGNVHEVPYMQAPLDWDKKTGKPKTESAPEHLMIRLLDGRQEMQASEIIPMVQAAYEENCIFPEEYFKTEKAYQKCEDTVMNHLRELEEALQKAKDGKLFFMDRTEREEKAKELQSQGKQIFEWAKVEDGVETKKEVPQVKMEPLADKDASEAIELLKQHPGYFSENDIKVAQLDFERHLENHKDDVHYFVLRSPEGKIEAIGGYGREKLSPDVYFIGWFAVDKDIQRRKLGGQLLESIEHDLKDKARMVIIRAEDKGDKDPTALFYKKHGYKKNGQVPDYWEDGSSLVYWSKRLRPKEEREKE